MCSKHVDIPSDNNSHLNWKYVCPEHYWLGLAVSNGDARCQGICQTTTVPKPYENPLMTWFPFRQISGSGTRRKSYWPYDTMETWSSYENLHNHTNNTYWRTTSSPRKFCMSVITGLLWILHHKQYITTKLTHDMRYNMIRLNSRLSGGMLSCCFRSCYGVFANQSGSGCQRS